MYRSLLTHAKLCTPGPVCTHRVSQGVHARNMMEPLHATAGMYCTAKNILKKYNLFVFSVQIEVVNTARRLNKFKRQDLQVKKPKTSIYFLTDSPVGFSFTIAQKQNNTLSVAGLLNLYKFKIHIMLHATAKNRIDRTQHIFQCRYGYQNNITLQIIALTYCIDSNSCSLS